MAGSNAKISISKILRKNWERVLKEKWAFGFLRWSSYFYNYILKFQFLTGFSIVLYLNKI